MAFRFAPSLRGTWGFGRELLSRIASVSIRSVAAAWKLVKKTALRILGLVNRLLYFMASTPQPEPKDVDFRTELDRLKKLSWPDDAAADALYDRWKADDPYLQRISPSLLNCADFCDYARTTGMITPFHLDPEDIKFASYALRLGGPIVYWDENDDLQQAELSAESPTFMLCGNSIAFVTLQPTLRIPDYIALRFNLKISHVYRGLLLGTGPLVDPGFRGRLSVPLHNLTTNNYTLTFGEKLIWVEFTKVSRNQKWPIKDPEVTPERACTTLYTTFPAGRNANVHDLLKDASPFKSVRSSIPEATTKALRASRQVNRIQIMVIAGVFISLIGFVAAVYQVVSFVPAVRDQLITEAANRDAKAKSELQNQLSASNETVRKLKQALIKLGKETKHPVDGL